MSNQVYGEWFGYPKCCIHYFDSGEVITEDQYMAANYTGFVPCPDHAKQVLKGDVKLEDLIKSRKCEVPFPGVPENGESRYTKILLHPKWKKDFKTKSFCLRLRGIKLSLKQRNRRKAS